MIDRQHGELIFECDVCDETLETGDPDFGQAMSLFRREGWRAEKVGEDWTHLCPQHAGRRWR